MQKAPPLGELSAEPIEMAKMLQIRENALDSCTVKITGQPDGATCQEYGDAILELI